MPGQSTDIKTDTATADIPAGASPPAAEAREQPAAERPRADALPDARRQGRLQRDHLAVARKRADQLQRLLDERMEQLALAEAQRDELNQRLDVSRLRHLAEIELLQAGAVDLEAAMALLDKRVDFSADPPEQDLREAVRRLLEEKGFLISARPGVLPGKSAGAQPSRAVLAARLARAAAAAAGEGSRRAVGEYLRLRRQSLQDRHRPTGA